MRTHAATMRQAITIDDRLLGRLLDTVQKPGRYIGGELHRVTKDPKIVAARACLAFPDSYEIGMSHLGLRILYAHLNKDDRIYVERAYCPFPDMEARLREFDVPIFSVETRTPLWVFDIVGFSLQSEMSNTNVLTMLDLGRIPLHRWERDGDDPIVMAGGPVVFNPEPMSDFIDVFLIGDGEEAFHEFLTRNAELKSQGIPRAERIATLACEITGLYAPALYKTRVDSATGFVHVCPPDNKALVGQEPALALRAPDTPATVIASKAKQSRGEPAGYTAGLLRRSAPRNDNLERRSAPRNDNAPPYPIRKALVDDVNRFPFPADILVPQGDIVHDRVAVEIARGCTEGCRFCQAGIIYRPVRERSPESIVNTIVEGIDKTGFEEASLTALSTADYSCITPLAKAVMAELQLRRSAMSVSSLRVYGVTEEIAREIAKVRKTGFTIAPEAGTQRMRDVINKGVTDANIDTAAEIAFSNGWTRLKLYFMIGLPTETDEDVMGIAETAIRVYQIGKRLGPRGITVVVSVSSLIPKAHSTFQWVPFDDPANLMRKQRMLHERLRKFKGIDLKTHEVRLSRLEAIFSRGDRRLGKIIESAWRKGARFDEWSDHFREEHWNNSFRDCGLDPEQFLPAIPTEAELIWDHIDSRVSKEFLLKDLKKGLASRFWHPCEKPYLPKRHDPPRHKDGTVKLVCYDCGVDCNLKAIAIEREQAGISAHEIVIEKEAMLDAYGRDRLPTVVARETGEFQENDSKLRDRDYEAAAQPFEPTKGPLYRFRVCYGKLGLSRYLSHLEVGKLIDRAGRRAKWPIAYSGGFHPHPKLSFGPALPVGVSGENEYFDVELTEPWTTDQLVTALNDNLHEGFAVRAAVMLKDGDPSIDSLTDRFDYTISFESKMLFAKCGDLGTLKSNLERRLTNGGWLIERVLKDRRKTINAAEFVDQWRFVADNGTTFWNLTLVSKQGRSVKPREMVESLLNGWPEGTTITRNRMGRLVDGRFLTPMELA